MKRLIIMLAALMLGACTASVEEDDGSQRVSIHDGTRYVGQDGVDQPATARTFMHRGSFDNHTDPGEERQGPFPDPWEQRTGPFPDPWQGIEVAPGQGKKSDEP